MDHRIDPGAAPPPNLVALPSSLGVARTASRIGATAIVPFMRRRYRHFNLEQARMVVSRQTRELGGQTALNEEPLVSLCVITHNHGRFLKSSLESVLTQQISVPTEVLVSDDGSTDETLTIALACQERHPKHVRILASHNRLGGFIGHGHLNLLRVFSLARGEFLAILEGDDLWTSVHKIERQLQLLIENPHLSFAATETVAVNEDGASLNAERQSHHRRGNPVIRFEDAVDFDRPIPAHLGSIVVRKSALRLSDAFIAPFAADRALLLHLLACGRPGAKIEEDMHIYRSHQQGITRTQWTSGIRTTPNALFYDRLAAFCRKSCKNEADSELALRQRDRWCAREMLTRSKGALGGLWPVVGRK